MPILCLETIAVRYVSDAGPHKKTGHIIRTTIRAETPSAADRALTQRLKEALGLVDVRVLDHIIVAGNETASFAEHGLI